MPVATFGLLIMANAFDYFTFLWMTNRHGLSAEDKLRMFEPYYSKKKKGTGLGLAIVATIIADHSGFVRVRDNHPQGTVIIIELPG